MGLFGSRGKQSLASKALRFISNNPDKVNSGIAKAGAFANKKTHGKYSRHITGAQTKAADALNKINRNNGGRGRTDGGPTFDPNR